jgi:hypothetical protein
MAISIYDTQAQLPPIDFNFLADRADKAEAKKLKNLELLGKASENLPIKGGYATQQLAKEYNSARINPLLDKYSTKIAKGEPLTAWYGDYMRDVKSIVTDPVYNRIKEDEAVMPEVQKLVSSPGHKYAAQYHDYFDPQKGFAQVGADQIMQGWTPGEWYKAEAPINYFDDFKDEFAAVKSKITQQYGDPVESLVRDDQGNVIAVLRTQEGKRREVLSRDMVKNMFRPMFSGQNYETLLGSKGSLRYNTLRSDKYARQQGLDMIADSGLAYPKEQALEDVVDHFLGGFETETELAPKSSQTKITGKPGGLGLGLGDTSVGGLPNEVALTLNKLGTLNTEGDVEGKTKVRPEVLVPMIGGRKEGNNFVVSFDNNNPAFLQVPKAVSGSGKEEDFSLAKALPYKLSYEASKEALVEDLYDFAKNKVRSVQGVDAEGNPMGFSYLDDGTIGVKDAAALQDPLAGWTSRISVDEFINQYLPNTELVNNPNHLQLSSLARQAQEQFGINLSDPDIQSKIDKIATSEQGKLYQEVAQSLASVQGNYQFYTDNSSDNLFLDETGTPIAKGFIVLDQEELKQILPNYSKAIDKGIITPYGFSETISDTGKKQKVTKYKIPVYRGTDADIDNTTQSYVDAAYGSRKDVDELRQGFLETSRSAFDNLSIGKKGYQQFNTRFNSAVASKESEPLKGDLMDASLKLGEVDQASATQANAEIMDLYNRYQDKKISKAALKKELYLMYLALQVKIAQQGDPTLQVPELELFLKTKEAFK